ncbi:hypothetical protein F0562_012377 [Nyssa sinensis]|uniref:Uncharacterized protein n=1 Tax=Nyssa sinensis TaxID=561372 RepID=A0A5J4ZUY7_9ASTE|nr:hypothetical protein F0562_012377 [Nyssa sinensis]
MADVVRLKEKLYNFKYQLCLKKLAKAFLDVDISGLDAKEVEADLEVGISSQGPVADALTEEVVAIEDIAKLLLPVVNYVKSTSELP